MDSFKELLGVVQRIEEAIKGEDQVKTTMRTRMKDYASVLQEMQGSTPAMYKQEVERLRRLVADLEDLDARRTAGAEDGRPAKIAKIAKRGTTQVSIEQLDAIDREFMRQLTVIAAKSSINPKSAETFLSSLRSPALDRAAVPEGALALPRNDVKRSGFGQAAQPLDNRAELSSAQVMVEN